MYCSQCGTRLDQRTGICPNCGLEHEIPNNIPHIKENPTPDNTYQSHNQQYYYQSSGEWSSPEYTYPNHRAAITEEELPAQYKPLGTFSYVLLMLLYSLPLVGFIFLIIHSLDESNINRRNYARATFCWMAIGIAICLIFILLFFVLEFFLIGSILGSTPAPMPIR
ncbi:MAG: hypothetical protein IKT46_01170 [Clostridia bacterium]|nr:hypothetical protein [Clostridia bacterium]